MRCAWRRLQSEIKSTFQLRATDVQNFGIWSVYLLTYLLSKVVIYLDKVYASIVELHLDA